MTFKTVADLLSALRAGSERERLAARVIDQLIETVAAQTIKTIDEMPSDK